MKTFFKTIIAATAISVFTISCNKEEYQTVNLSETAITGQTYTIALPITDDAYAITTEAKYASQSSIGVDSLGNPVYIYTSINGYIGPDQVVLTTNHDNQLHVAKPMNPRGPKGPKGACNTEDDYIVNINFNVINNPALN